jgi:hypothetical protein
MKVVGIFRELGREISSSAASVFAAAGALSPDVSEALANYLESGIPVFDVMGGTFDPFDRSKTIVGGPSLLSDGEWVWRDDLAYLVRKYRVAVSREFVAHALEKKRVDRRPEEVVREWLKAVEDHELEMFPTKDS